MNLKIHSVLRDKIYNYILYRKEGKYFTPNHSQMGINRQVKATHAQSIEKH